MRNKYTELMTVRVSPEIREQVKILSEKLETSESSIIRRALSKYLVGVNN